MKTPIAPKHRLLQSSAVADISFHAFIIGAGQTARIAARSEQGFDFMAASDQFMNQVCPDKSGSAGDKTFHQLAILNFCRRSSNLIVCATKNRAQDRILL